MYDFEFTADADLEVTDAYVYYDSKQKGLGEKFLDELYVCIKSICREPFQYQKRRQYHEAVVSKFPYLIIYGFTGQLVTIYSVFNSHRNPKRKP